MKGSFLLASAFCTLVGCGQSRVENKDGPPSQLETKQDSGEFTLSGHKGYVRSVAFSADGKLLASATGWLTEEQGSGEAKVWDLASRTCKCTVPIDRFTGASSVRFSADNKYLFCNQLSKLLVFELPDGTLHPSRAPHGSQRCSWALIPDGTGILTVRGRQMFQSDLTGSKWEFWRSREEAFADCLAFSNDGRKLAVGAANDREIILFDAVEKKELRSLAGHTGNLRFLAFSRDDSLLVSAAEYDRKVIFWDPDSGSDVGGFLLDKEQEIVAELSPTGKVLAIREDWRTLDFREVPSGRRIGTHSTGQDIIAVAFSPDGQSLALGRDRDVVVYQLKSLGIVAK